MQKAKTSTINVSLPNSLKEFVLAQVESGGYGSASEYIRKLIRDARTEAEHEQSLSLRSRDVVGKHRGAATT